MNKKMWHKLNKLKNKKMEQIKNEEIQIEEEQKAENATVVSAFKTAKYKTKFSKITAYRLPEDSTIHCSNGEKLNGKLGDFYVCIDAIQEVIIPENIFKKLFLFDHKNNV
jgi:hypothetical protein